jgi:16S rRNA (cytidine1402-2'-O)-methyltransferase
MTGTLYIVATPIGNLEDITLRALRILRESDVILTEDTRVSRVLLKHYDLDVPTLSYHQHSGEEKKLEILKLLMEGKNLSLITDAGTPGVSDPGNELIDFLLTYIPDLKIIPVPGASALTSSLSICGFDINKFVFLGFLPKKKRNKLFEWIKEGPSAISGRTFAFAFYESPKRILKTLEMLERVFGGYIRVFIARELTKLHETLYRGRIRKVHDMLEKDKIKGEIVVVVEI